MSWNSNILMLICQVSLVSVGWGLLYLSVTLSAQLKDIVACWLEAEGELDSGLEAINPKIQASVSRAWVQWKSGVYRKNDQVNTPIHNRTFSCLTAGRAWLFVEVLCTSCTLTEWCMGVIVRRPLSLTKLYWLHDLENCELLCVIQAEKTEGGFDSAQSILYYLACHKDLI